VPKSTMFLGSIRNTTARHCINTISASGMFNNFLYTSYAHLHATTKSYKYIFTNSAWT